MNLLVITDVDKENRQWFWAHWGTILWFNAIFTVRMRDVNASVHIWLFLAISSGRKKMCSVDVLSFFSFMLKSAATQKMPVNPFKQAKFHDTKIFDLIFRGKKS